MYTETFDQDQGGSAVLVASKVMPKGKVLGVRAPAMLWTRRI